MEALNLGFTIIRLEDIGYLAIYLIMVLDGANVPFTPNELFLSFTGYLAKTGEVNPVLGFLVGLLGSFTGHLMSYAVGWKLGRPLFDRFGKLIFISKKNIKDGERKIKSFGFSAPFVVRFIPGLRNISSLFFGIFKSPPGNFLLLTAAGISIYNALFFLTGYVLAEQFARFKEIIFPAVVTIIAGGLIGAAISWYRNHELEHRSKRKAL